MRMVAAIVVFAGVAGSVLQGQQSASAASDTPKFEVASIKVNKSGRDGWDGFKISHGTFNVANASLHMLITGAFALQKHRVLGGPAWLTTERFDISAKGDPGASNKQVLQMIQSLLMDRFGLVVHRETRDLPVYTLVPTKNGSSKLAKVKDTVCETPTPERGGKIDFMQATSCGEIAAVGGPQRGVLWGKSAQISALADGLSGLTDRPVVDRTGLSGQFDFQLWWSDGSQPVLNENERPRDTAPEREAPISIFVAVQEQLGLRLETARGPVEVLVIDHVAKPSQN